MEKLYTTPVMEITEFDVEDVITTSGGIPLNDGDGNGDTGSGDWGGLNG